MRAPWGSGLFTSAIILGSGLAGGLIAARYLGPEGRGALEGITFWAHFSVGFITIGLNEAIAIAVAKQATHRSLASTAVWLSIALGTLLVAILAAIMPLLISDDWSIYATEALCYAAILIPTTLVAQNLLGIVQGRQNFTEYNTQRIYQALAYPICLSTLIMLDALTVTTAALAMLTGTCIVAIMRIQLIRDELTTPPCKALATQLLRSGSKIHVANMALLLAAQLDILILLQIGSRFDLGIYVTSMVLGRTVVGLFVQTYTSISLPMVAKIQTTEMIWPAVRKSVWTVLAILAITCSVCWAILPFAVPILFGEEFRSAIPVAQILTIACGLAGFRKVLIYILRSHSMNRDGAIAEAVTGIIVLLGLLEFYSSGGVQGAAWIVLVANAAGTGIMCFAFHRTITRR